MLVLVILFVLFQFNGYVLFGDKYVVVDGVCFFMYGVLVGNFNIGKWVDRFRGSYVQFLYFRFQDFEIEDVFVQCVGNWCGGLCGRVSIYVDDFVGDEVFVCVIYFDDKLYV